MKLAIQDLFRRIGDELALNWDGNSGQRHIERLSHSNADSDPTAPLVSYLNFIHPPQVQVIGAAELNWLADQPRRSLAGHWDRVLEETSRLVIFVDGEQPEQALKSKLQRNDVPLFTTTTPGYRVVHHLRYLLNQKLAAQETLHGVFLEVHSIGVLITGKSGIGKSELALELLSRGHRLVADDAPLFRRLAPDVVSGTCPAEIRDFLEVRGLGILNITRMFGSAAIKESKKLRMIVHLVRQNSEELPAPNRLQGNRKEREVLGVPVCEITLPVAAGHNLAVLIETACRDHILRIKGYEADEAFIQHHDEMMRKAATAENFSDSNASDSQPLQPTQLPE